MQFNKIIKIIQTLCEDRERLILGIAGPPASGKSTLAEKVVSKIHHSVLVPMDGFHLSNEQLDKAGLRDKKGAPETFDSEGFISFISKIRGGPYPLDIPEFDRDRDCVVFNGKQVSSLSRVIVVEGNYLFLDRDPWRKLHSLIDYSLFLTPSLEVIEKRIFTRWLDHKLSLQEAALRAERNDLPNARLVLEHSIHCDLEFEKVTFD